MNQGTTIHLDAERRVDVGVTGDDRFTVSVLTPASHMSLLGLSESEMRALSKKIAEAVDCHRGEPAHGYGRWIVCVRWPGGGKRSKMRDHDGTTMRFKTYTAAREYVQGLQASPYIDTSLCFTAMSEARFDSDLVE
jgi:hypothetical protein